MGKIVYLDLNNQKGEMVLKFLAGRIGQAELLKKYPTVGIENKKGMTS